MENNKKLELDTFERPTPLKWILLSIQHVFAMFGATVLVPITTGLDIGVGLIASGIGTILYILMTKAKVPMYLGSSFAFVAAIISAKQGDSFDAALTGIVVAGLIYIIVAVFIKFFGINWLKWLLPSVVVGPIIIVIGLSLAPVAVGQITKLANGTSIGWQGYLVAVVTFLTVITISIKGKGFVKIIPFLFGIIAGYATSAIVQIIDYSHFNNLSFFSLPKFNFIGMYKPNFSAVAIFIPLAFVTIMEHIGDHEVLGTIMDRDFLSDPGLHKTLLGDGLATMAAGLIGGPANTSYGENTGVVALTKVGSVWVTGGAAIVAILLAFVSPIRAFIQSIPLPVLGGMSLVLFGMIAANGLKVLVQGKVDLENNRNIIIIASMLVVGLGGLAINFAGGDIKIETMALSAVIGILLNLYFKLLDKINFKKEKNE